MAQIVILREKSMAGILAPIDCYVNGAIVCKVKNGERVSCEVADAVVGFKCKMLSNPTSEEVFLDLTDGRSVQIKVKQCATKTAVSVDDMSVVTTRNLIPSQTAIQRPTKADFSPTRKIGVYFAIDENARLWTIGKGIIPTFNNSTPYSYDDIIDFELIEDGSSIVKGGVGRAIVGGALFGGVGAIVGGATGKKKAKQTCTNLSIKITVNNMANPVEYIKIIATETPKSGFVYKSSYQVAQEIISLLQLICSQRKVTNEANNMPAQQLSEADELRKYKALMDDGIITEEEFQAKKKQLLGL